MDAIARAPPEDGVQDLNLISATDWTGSTPQSKNNSTLLYISVEYKMEPNATLASQQDVYNDFEQHVSPLDPNMSSVARYSPVYSEPSTEFNPIVIHQLVQSDNNQNTQFTNNSALEVMPTVLCNNTVENSFLQLEASPVTTETTVTHVPNELQLIPEDEREVELLITDQATGISYSVRSQEFLVERCLEDEQLLNALSPDPLLDSDLLALDENTLKTELSEDMINAATSVVTTIDSASVCNYVSNLISNADDLKIESKQNWQREIEFEDQLLSRVYSIIDKPVLSRARASLPESYLTFNKVNDECGVFAKKHIPKSTQFGPMTGVLTVINMKIEDSDNLQYLVENEDGKMKRLDISDENEANWMIFVRRATNFQEQNLVLCQEGAALYFTTTQNILPKQELKVGYSVSYASRRNLTALKHPEDNSWPCFECTASFSSSDDLQNHLNVHDNDKDENMKPRKKCWKKRKLIQPKILTESLKCNTCNEIFVQPPKIFLRHHLIDGHKLNNILSVDEHYTVVTNFKCEDCNLIFDSDALFKTHNLMHDFDSSDEQTNHVCPSCFKKFPTQRQLVTHISVHALTNVKVIHTENTKCPVCHKIFAFRERLRRHMLVHGSDDSKPLQCTTCNKRFLNNSALAGHVKTHFAGKKVFECPICKVTFDHVLKLKLHVPNHCENNLYSCPHCTKVFKKYSIIRKHIRAFHCEQKHACPHCIKMFPTLDKLRMHMLRHSDHREFLCADCGKQFKRKDKLKEHCKRMHSEERENNMPKMQKNIIIMQQAQKKLTNKSEPTDFHRFIYKCHTCMVGFKRRGMLVNHLAKRHPDISPDSVPELNLPILQTTRDYYCQHCDKVYKSSSKRKAHILKNHPGAALPMSNRKQGAYQGLPNPSFSQTVGSITTRPQNCQWCHKQYASKAKLLQHQRKKHGEQLAQQTSAESKCGSNSSNGSLIDDGAIQSDDKLEIDNCLQDDYKVSDVDILSRIEDFNGRNASTQYCHLVTIGGNDSELGTSNSHLYRLLTTSDGMVPPR